MPRRRHRRHRMLRDVNDEDLFECVTGGRYFEPLLPEDVLREVWMAWREELMAAWTATGPWPALLIESFRIEASAQPGTRPHAWWLFDAPERRTEHETEAEQLARLGLLTSTERVALERTGDAA